MKKLLIAASLLAALSAQAKVAQWHHTPQVKATLVDSIFLKRRFQYSILSNADTLVIDTTFVSKGWSVLAKKGDDVRYSEGSRVISINGYNIHAGINRWRYRSLAEIGLGLGLILFLGGGFALLLYLIENN